MISSLFSDTWNYNRSLLINKTSQYTYETGLSSNSWEPKDPNSTPTKYFTSFSIGYFFIESPSKYKLRQSGTYYYLGKYDGGYIITPYLSIGMGKSPESMNYIIYGYNMGKYYSLPGEENVQSDSHTIGWYTRKNFKNNFDYIIGTIFMPYINEDFNSIAPKFIIGLSLRVPITDNKFIPITLHTFLPSFVVPHFNHLSVNIGYIL